MKLKPLNANKLVITTPQSLIGGAPSPIPKQVKQKKSGNIVVKNPIAKTKDLKSSIAYDPSGILNNSIFSLIKVIKFKMISIFIISLSICLAGVGWLLADYFMVQAKWVGYLPAALIVLLSGYKFCISWIELKALNRDVLKYRADVQNGMVSTPPFMIRIYSNMNMRQVSHNWYSFFIFFFGGIFLTSIYFLQSWSFWKLDFRNWITDAFVNVQLVEIIGLSILGGTIIIHFVFAIFRKKRIYQLDSYFGESIVNSTSLLDRKKSLNKFYRRIFFIIILVVFLIPLIVWLVLKIIKPKS